MASFVSDVIEIGSFGLIDDPFGIDAAEEAAGRAADVQEDAAAAGRAEVARQFDVTQANLAPFQEAGVSALEQQRILLGLGGSAPVDPNAEQRASLEAQIAELSGSGGGAQPVSTTRGLFSQATAGQRQG